MGVDLPYKYGREELKELEYCSLCFSFSLHCLPENQAHSIMTGEYSINNKFVSKLNHCIYNRYIVYYLDAHNMKANQSFESKILGSHQTILLLL